MGLNYHPNKVSWKDVILTGRSRDLVPSDGCEVVGTLTLPARMRTRLDPEDWRPIIASSLVYEWKLNSRRAKHFLTCWLLYVIFPLSILTTLILFLFSPRDLPRIPAITLVIGIIALGPALLITAPYAQKTRLLADTIAAERFVDRDSFIRVLEKIDALDLEDILKIERRRGLMVRFTRRPSISERIENLKAFYPSRVPSESRT